MEQFVNILLAVDEVGDALIDNLTAYPSMIADANAEHFVAIQSSGWPSGRSNNGNNEWISDFDDIVAKLIDAEAKEVDLTVIYGPCKQRDLEYISNALALFNKMPNLRVTRRLCLIYPTLSSNLKFFCESVYHLFQNEKTLVNCLREVHFLANRNRNADCDPSWNTYEKAALETVNTSSKWRTAVDSALAHHHSPLSSSCLGHCVFDVESWQYFFNHRVRYDLTVLDNHVIEIDLEKESTRFIEEFRVCTSCYEISLAKPKIDHLDSSHGSTIDAWQILCDSIDQMRTHQLDKHSERFEELKHSYTRFLNDLARHRNPLTGLIQAVATHERVMQFLDCEESHTLLMEKILKSRNTISFLRAIAHCLDNIVADQQSEFVDSLDPFQFINTLTARLAKISEWDNLSELKQLITKCLLNMLKVLSDFNDLNRPKTGLGDSEAAALLTHLTGLDHTYEVICEAMNNEKAAIIELKENLKGIQRIVKPREYRVRRQEHFKEIARLKAQAKEWFELVNSCLKAVSLFELFRVQNNIIAELLDKTQESLQCIGSRLQAIVSSIQQVHIQATALLQNIEDEPVLSGSSMSFLAKTEMENLYTKLSKVRCEKYGEYLEEQISEGQEHLDDTITYRFELLEKYNYYLEPFCDIQFKAVPKLDLPILMFDYFPDLWIDRLNQLIKLVAVNLIPLAERNKKERRYLMIIEVPRQYQPMFLARQGEFVYADTNTALQPAEIDYLNSSDHLSLTLMLMLYNFRSDDYRYWTIPGDENPPF